MKELREMAREQIKERFPNLEARDQIEELIEKWVTNYIKCS